MSSELEFSTMQDCSLDIELSFGHGAARRFRRLLDVTEANIGRKLTREEVLDRYRTFCKALEIEKQGRC